MAKPSPIFGLMPVLDKVISAHSLPWKIKSHGETHDVMASDDSVVATCTSLRQAEAVVAQAEVRYSFQQEGTKWAEEHFRELIRAPSAVP